MRKITSILILLMTLISCGDRVQFLHGFDFSKDNWLLTHSDNYGMIELIDDENILNQLSNDLKIVDDEKCHYTTPDYCFDLYKNGQRVKTLCYCNKMLVDFGRLKKYFVKANKKHIQVSRKDLFNRQIDSLNSSNNAFVIGESDTLPYNGQLKVNVVISDKGDDIIEYRKKIENLCRTIYGKGDYEVFADFSLSTPDKRLGYNVYFRCDSDYVKGFDFNKIKQNDYFIDCKLIGYDIDLYRIDYLEKNK